MGLLTVGETKISGLLEGEDVLRSTKADNYGDFEFEGLMPGMTYQVTVSAPGYESCELAARTNLDVYLGEIVLAPAGTVDAGAGPKRRPAGGGR